MAVLALKQWVSLKFMQSASIISSETFWKIYLHRWINLEFLWSSQKVLRTSTRVVQFLIKTFHKLINIFESGSLTRTVSIYNTWLWWACHIKEGRRATEVWISSCSCSVPAAWASLSIWCPVCWLLGWDRCLRIRTSLHRLYQPISQMFLARLCCPKIHKR